MMVSALRAANLTWRAAVLAVALSAGAAGADPAPFPPDPSLDDYLALARVSAPRVTAAQSAATALADRADGAGALPDLKLAWGEMIVPVETRVGPQQRVFSVSQSLPWFGTLGLRREEAAAQAARASSQAAAVALDLEREIRGAWNDLALAQRERALVAEHLALAGQIETITRASYEAGGARYGQVLQAEMETGRLASRREELGHRLDALTARLNTLAGLDPAHRMPAARLDDRPAHVDTLSLPDLLALLPDGNPGLQALAHETAAREAAVDLAGRSGKPGFTLGLDYIMTGQAVQPDLPDSGKDPVIARVAVSLPLWGGQAAAESRAAVGRLAAARAQSSAARLDLSDALADAHARRLEARTRVALYRDTLLPRARQALDVTRADYEAGRAAFADLVEARRALLTLELDLLRTRREGIRARDHIESLLGGSDTLKGDLS